MTIKEIFELATTSSFFQMIFVIIICSIKIPKKEINIWGIIGNSINKDLKKEINSLNDKLDLHIEQDNIDKVCLARKRILRFNDEILHDIRHSEEYFDDILSDIDTYEKYCNTHPEFPNNKAMLSIQNIKQEYMNLFE